MSAADGRGGAKLPLSALAAYGAPALAAALLGLPLILYAPTYYADNLGLGFAAVGAVLAIARIWDVVTDPIVGWACDRYAGPWGRRRSWLVASAPLTLLGAWFLFQPSADASLWYLILWALLAYLGWTMMTVPHQAWGAELTASYAERSRVMASREMFGLLGVMLAAAAPSLLRAGGFIAEDQDDVAVTLAVLAWCVVVLLPLTGAIMFALVPEPPRAAPPAPPGRRAGLRLLGENAPFRRLLIAYLVNGIANGLPTALFLLFVTHILALPEYTGIFLLAYFGAGVLGMPLWLKFARRLSKHRVWCLAMLYNSLIFAMVPMLGRGDFLGYLALCLATGLAFGADLALPPSMQADVVDVDTDAGGDQRTALYFALWGMATKLAQALAVGVAFPALAWFGFSAETSDPEMGRFGLIALYGGLPVLFKLAAIALMWNFPLDAAAHAALRARIATTRA